MKRYFLTYILLCILSFTASSCKDDLLYNGGEVGEGECVISGTVKFKSFTPALNGSTRAEDVTGGTKGDAIKQIKSLCVLLYGENKKLLDKYFLMPEGETGADGADGVYKVENVSRPKGDNGYMDADGNPLPPAEVETPRATFTLKIPYGTYYIYAVANMGNLSEFEELIQDVDGLKSIPLQWNEGNIAANSQMFGHFFSDTNTEPLLTIDKTSKKLQAWVRRAASKVTVAYDGSGLKEGVSIYIKALRIKNIPKSCWLGKDNKVGQASGGEDSEGEGNEGETASDLVIPTGEEVKYSTSETFDENYPALITKKQPYYPRKEITNEDGTMSWSNVHSEDNPHSLFFYENMQGEGPDKSAAVDENKDGLLENPYTQGKKYGTYIEVDAYYKSTNPQRPGISEITYRFMLGQNVSTDYNAKRNCHYKLTLHFKGFADEPDWRIDYVTKFGVSQPYDVNYQGKYWLPDNVTDNQGNNFYGNNTITVASYRYNTEIWDKREALDYTIEYKDSVDSNFPNGEFSDKVPSWLDGALENVTEQYSKEKAQGLQVLKIKYKNDYKEVDIDKLLKSRTNTGTTDLASKGTANCYIVDAKGTYTLPLVYGNAIAQGGKVISSSYSGFSGDDRVLTTFKNYNNEAITSPYILDDVDVDRTGTITPCVVWQDSENLISSVSYEPAAYGGKGGLKFEIGNIAQGNAVIAIKKDGVIVWSWHIWVTSKELTDRIWTIKKYKNNAVDAKYDVMPVNLGWCSNPDETIRYYDRHQCEVKFKQILSKNDDGTLTYGSEQVVTIIQEPHISLPRGNNTYYQWGRKDPLVGTNASWANKTWWCTNGTTLEERKTQPDFLNPSLFLISYVNGEKIYSDNPDGIDPNYRETSMVSLGRMIQNPHKLNNPRRKDFVPGKLVGGKLEGGNEGTINDEIHSNLWLDDKKTIYDPCPPGYKVAPVSAFTAFTTNGGYTSEIALHGYNVSQDNMLTKYKESNMEFYVDGKRKLISVTFPLSGYRDYDAGEVYHVGLHLYVWEARNFKNGVTYQENNYSNFLKAYFNEGIDDTGNFTGNTTGYIGVDIWEAFYATDACSVRPVKE